MLRAERRAGRHSDRARWRWTGREAQRMPETGPSHWTEPKQWCSVTTGASSPGGFHSPRFRRSGLPVLPVDHQSVRIGKCLGVRGLRSSASRAESRCGGELCAPGIPALSKARELPLPMPVNKSVSVPACLRVSPFRIIGSGAQGQTAGSR